MTIESIDESVLKQEEMRLRGLWQKFVAHVRMKLPYDDPTRDALNDSIYIISRERNRREAIRLGVYA